MSAGHTPGPWHIGGKTDLIIYASDGFAVADAVTYHGTFKQGQDAANARLIASAPDLLDALEDAGAAIRELRLADGHAARTGDETRFDRALASVCQHENRIKILLAEARGHE